MKKYYHKLYRTKRPHRKITKYGIFESLTERLLAEVRGLLKYKARVRNQKN